MLARHHDLRHTHGDPKGSGGIAAPMLVHQACHGRRAADLGTPSVFDDNVSARHILGTPGYEPGWPMRVQIVGSQPSIPTELYAVTA